MDRYRCLICDYMYDPEAGDPENGVAPGTAFEDLPADWVCPLCGADQSNFEKI
jgi:rubredoxin